EGRAQVAAVAGGQPHGRRGPREGRALSRRGGPGAEQAQPTACAELDAPHAADLPAEDGRGGGHQAARASCAPFTSSSSVAISAAATAGHWLIGIDFLRCQKRARSAGTPIFSARPR